MSQKTIADIFADHITASPHDTLVTDRILLHSGAKSIAEVCRFVIEEYAKAIVEGNLRSGQDETLAAKTAEAQMEADAASMLSAQNEACAKCPHILSCSAYDRVMSSIVIDPQVGAACLEFNAAFLKAGAEITRKTIGQFTQS